ncbi:MAG TPA: DUF3426 domain-containing protein [Ramlibacter sp.]|nr:DUF3426 domain-containing protein [Ramlibacter sp.]
MSLITRCPACGTMFKVVPDQLRISEGWVRCGQCAEVFDASAHLQENAAQPPTEVATDVAAAPRVASKVEVDAIEAAPESEAFDSSLNTELEEGIAIEAPDSRQIDEEAQALKEDPLDLPFEFRRPDDSDARPSRSARSDADSDSGLDSDLQSENEAGLHDVSFVRDARRNAIWARPGVRAVLLVAALALAATLALQVAVHDRDRLAAAQPALQPWLANLCAALGCRIGPPRQIDAIAIDSSSFNKLRGDAYRLNVTLKNQAGISVAMPALELTLTDAQDQPLVRRVLMPAELGPGRAVIAPASEWSGSLAMAVPADGAGARVTGYRLLAFYP